MDFLTKLDFWFTVLRCATPVLFATLAALVATRSGIMNLGIEGAMTVAALGGVLGSGFTGSLLLGLFAGMGAGAAFTMFLAYAIQHMKANRVIAGVAMNLAAAGGSVFCLYSITGDKNSSNSLASSSFPAIEIPIINRIPLIGDVFSGHNCLTYLAFVLAVVIFIVLKKTAFGIHVQAVGESEEAARSVGIPVEKVRYQAMLISGVLASLGGMYLSMGYINRFTSGMVAGRGYIALATNAMSAGNAILGILSSSLYGLGSTIAIYLQNENADPYLISIIPYMSIIIFYILFRLYHKRRES